jgi:hypothetical protein
MSASFIPRKLLVDGRNQLFDARGMKEFRFRGDYSMVRAYAKEVLADCPPEFRDGTLLEQQVSELIKNGIKHGNRKDPAKTLTVWCDTRRRVRLIVEDEGEGFVDLDRWNEFYEERQRALFERRFDDFLSLASWRGPRSEEEDGGNSIIAALEYWNGGMIYNDRRNKVGVMRWYSRGT